MFVLVEQLCSMVHLVGFSPVHFMDDCNAIRVAGTRVFEQLWSSGDGMWLFPTLVCLIAGHSVVLSWCACGFSHRRVGVGYALRVSPVVTRLTVYRRTQVDEHVFVRKR